MILVFGAFILGGKRVIKEFGLGLAGGILIDAVFIRMAVVPSVMFLLGKSNWWFPKWLAGSSPTWRWTPTSRPSSVSAAADRAPSSRSRSRSDRPLNRAARRAMSRRSEDRQSAGTAGRSNQGDCTCPTSS